VTDADHRPEVAIPLIQPLWIEAKRAGPDAERVVSGYAVAVGWDRPQQTTFYLVSDANFPRPVWVPEEEITSNTLRPPAP
jgi:hypothetical protein